MLMRFAVTFIETLELEIENILVWIYHVTYLREERLPDARLRGLSDSASLPGCFRGLVRIRIAGRRKSRSAQ